MKVTDGSNWRETTMSEVLAWIQQRNAMIQNLGLISPLPKDFPLHYSPEFQETLIARLREHSWNLDNYFSQINNFPLFDKMNTLSNIEAAYDELYRVILPMVETWLMPIQYQPMTPVLDHGVINVITQAIQPDREFTQLEKELWELLIQTIDKYRRFHDFRAWLRVDEDKVISDLAKAVQWKVNTLD